MLCGAQRVRQPGLPPRPTGSHTPRSIFVKRTLPHVGGDHWKLMMYNSPLSVVMLLPIVALSGEMGEFVRALPVGALWFRNLIISGGFGFLISAFRWWGGCGAR